MDINLNNNTLCISGLENKRAQIMMGHYGLMLDGNDYKHDSFDDIEKLIRIINYFHSQKIEYTLDQNAEEKINDFNTKKNLFIEKKELLNSYKKGNYNKDQYNSFIQLLNQAVPTRELRDHQLKSAYHLYLSENGANFSVPGAGKTTVVLSVYEILRQQGLVNTLFVIGPTTCFFAWVDEFYEVLDRRPEYKILAGGDKTNRKSYYYNFSDNRPELYISSFQTLANDIEDVTTFLNSSVIKPFIVIDEAHYIKRLNGQWSSGALALSSSAKYKCILTGTPMPRSFTDLYNLFYFLWPEYNPISTSTKNLLAIHDENQYSETIAESLEVDIGSLHYRVRKSELGLAKQIMHPPIQIPMGGVQRNIYDMLRDRLVNLNKKEGLTQELELVDSLRKARIIRLRQVASYPKLLLNTLVNYEFTNQSGFNDELSFQNTDIGDLIQTYDENEIPSKTIELLNLVKRLQLENKKVIIWSSFVGTIKYLSRVLSKNNIVNKKVYGEIPFLDHPYKDIESREKIRQEFVDHNSGLDVIIANPAAFAESVSLHKGCQHAIYYDLSYNCAQFLQSLDRIHRVGGSEEIESHYYFLQNVDSLDSDIYDNLMVKRDKMYDLIERDYSIYSLEMEEADEEDELLAYKRIFAVE